MATLSIALILLPLGAFVLWQVRTDLQIQRNLRYEIEAFYIAEAGIAHALSEIGPAQNFEGVLNGPDGISGTADDGIFPFVEGPPGYFPSAPFHYEVRVSPAGSGMVKLLSVGLGQHGATKAVEALVARAPLPVTPAALYTEGDVTAFDMGDGGFLVSGFDRSDAGATDAQGDTPIPALATPDASAEDILRQSLLGASTQRLTGAGGEPSIATVAPLNLDSCAQQIAGRSEAVVISQGLTSVLGTTERSQISIVDGDLEVADRTTGSGILVIRGTFHVSGTFMFTGLVLVMGGIVFEPSSQVTVLGAVWRAASADGRLQLAGGGEIEYSSGVLGQLDVMFPGLLPHPAVVVGWQEQL